MNSRYDFIKNALLIFFVLNGLSGQSQSLGKERIDRIKRSVVRVWVDDRVTGTGFFVSEDGWIATCHHVVEPAFILNPITKMIDSVKHITVEFANGERVRVDIPTKMTSVIYEDMFIFDFFLMKPAYDFSFHHSHLNLGSWTDANEGDLVYTSGFPLGIQQSVITCGMVSAKWVDKISGTSRRTGEEVKIERKVAWLDMTMNRGNSGGPIVVMGEDPKDDRVIGIATFILNPYGNISDGLATYFRKLDSGIQIGKNDHNDFTSLLFEAVSKNSLGVGGVISIQYLISSLETITAED